MFAEVINLVYTERYQDPDGFPVSSEFHIEVFANKKSVTRAEFYNAMQTGMKPSILFEIHLDDWEMTKQVVEGTVIYANKVEYESCIYDILRTYEKDRSIMELVCG